MPLSVNAWTTLWNRGKNMDALDNGTIMVVDDTPANLKLLDGMLRDRGYRVLTFPGGEMALNAARERAPDLILLDINMPKMNGFEVCERLKADDSLKDVPVIFISALTDTMDKLKAFGVGGVDYVTKPFQAEEVIARVETHLALRSKTLALLAAYDQLRQLESLRDSLVHMIVHDMRSPLSGIRGYLDLILMDNPPAEIADDIESAQKSTDTLIEMLNDLLDISKLEAGEIQLQCSSIDLRELVGESVHALESLKRGRTVTVDMSEDGGTLWCDRKLISRVLQNLLTNAQKFTDEESGVISVGSKSGTGSTVQIFVADNGPGIPEEYREKVFDKFFQLTAHEQGVAKSTGLGLTFCKLAVEAHGGRIGVDGVSGGGSTFWIEIPRRAQ